MKRLLSDIEGRLGKIRAAGDALLIECEDHALANLIAHDSRTRRLCMLTGERHLTVRAADESAFIRGLRQIGYILSPEEARVR